jgi:hypothetical protein
VAARDVGDLAPGDFVRTVKSVADLVQQVAHAATDPETADAAREAVAMLLRGVVAAACPPRTGLIRPPIRHQCRHPSPMVGRACSPT